jgi:hypothetical protein
MVHRRGTVGGRRRACILESFRELRPREGPIRDECRGHASSPGTIGQVVIVRFPSRANIEIGVAFPSSSTAIGAVAIAKPAFAVGMGRFVIGSGRRGRAPLACILSYVIAILVGPTETLSWGMYLVVECSSCYRHVGRANRVRRAIDALVMFKTIGRCSLASQ